MNESSTKSARCAGLRESGAPIPDGCAAARYLSVGILESAVAIDEVESTKHELIEATGRPSRTFLPRAVNDDSDRMPTVSPRSLVMHQNRPAAAAAPIRTHTIDKPGVRAKATIAAGRIVGGYDAVMGHVFNPSCVCRGPKR